MPFKSQAPDARPLLLPWGLLELTGQEAVGFAQAQFTNDVSALEDDRWQWNAWLTPKGRVIAVFALLRLDAGRLWLLLPDFDARQLQERLQRFVFRTKVVLSVRTDQAVVADVAADLAPAPPAPGAIGRCGSARVLDMGGSAGARQLLLAPAEALRDGVRDAAAERAWRATDLAYGLPRLEPGQSEAWTPQMLGLDRLRAVSLAKGCYPGQEIVSRTHYLGQAKRGPVRLQGDALSAGAEIRRNGSVAGTVVAAAGSEALAVLALEHAEAGDLACGAAPCRPLPLLDGLAR